MVRVREKAILRELAARYGELASRPEQEQRRRRIFDTNDLKPCRPPVFIDEIPWFEMDIDGKLKLECEDGFARRMEWYFRSSLFRAEYFPVDTVFEPLYPINKSFELSYFGIGTQEEIIAADSRNNIVSHLYRDVLANDGDLEKVKIRTVTAHPETDRENLETAQEILGGILPVTLRGTEIYYAPWDQIPRYRGVENTLMQLYDNPEFMHRVIKRFTDDQQAQMLQLERLGLLEVKSPRLHCTPGYVTGVTDSQPLPNGGYSLKNCWFRSMAQLFGSVSPQMHYEFDLQYSLPLMAQCAYTYYGCCEPLDTKTELLEKIPNLRKIGVSPWADQEKLGDFIRGRYVYARKPNPAEVALDFDETEVAGQIEKTVKICKKYGCPYEFVLKDISTVSGKPGNIIKWAATVKKVLDKYYG